MSSLMPIREKPSLSPLKSGDVLVLFGELFTRGYANGLVEEAQSRGMTIIRSTVGRREKDLSLRALNAEEEAQVPKPFINVPLEAGFDLEVLKDGSRIVDHLKDVKLNDWEKATISPSMIAEAKESGRNRFRENVRTWVEQITPHVTGRNIVFAHLMAGGVPRTKIVMPLMNRVFKGTGDRFIASEPFWNSGIGRLCAESFNEVTAYTLQILLEETAALREKSIQNGHHVSYVGYGYHGTEIYIENELKWQTYAPYLQGFAKIELEKISTEFFKKGVATCIYNCPEILTNSSSIFQGVEVPLYPLLRALEKNANPEAYQKIASECLAKLKDGESVENILRVAYRFLTSPEAKAVMEFSAWPQHSNQVQLESMLQTSDQLISMQKSEKDLITSLLSEVVFKSCGYLMLHDSWAPRAPVQWIGHDVVAKAFTPA
jgi:urease gamma subunit